MRPFTVNIYCGVFFRHDAISNSVFHKLRVIEAMARDGAAIAGHVYTLGTDYRLPNVTIVRSAGELIMQPGFNEADLHIHEFGIVQDLFNAALLHVAAPKIVFYHNITPLHLAPDDAARATIEKSFVQQNNLFLADRIVSISEFSRRELVAFGIDTDRLSTMHLPPSIDVDFPPRPGFAATGDRPMRILFVGRFARAKGILDLVTAMGILKRHGPDGVVLDLVGATRFSNSATIAELEALIAAEGVGDIVRVRGELSDGDLAGAYRAADIFAIPSYHEGFCVPLLEAMTAGCFPVAYDAGNLPFLMAGLGRLAPVGDIDALAAALLEIAGEIQAARTHHRAAMLPTERGRMEEADWRDAMRQHTQSYSRAAFETAMTAFFADHMARAGNRGAPAIAAAI